MIAIKLKFYEPEEEVCEGQGLNCAYVDSTGAIWTPTVFTQFLLGIIASRVTTQQGYLAPLHGDTLIKADRAKRGRLW